MSFSIKVLLRIFHQRFYKSVTFESSPVCWSLDFLRKGLCFRSCSFIPNSISQSQISKTLWNLAQRLLMAMARDSQSPIFYFYKKGVNIAEKGVKKPVFRRYWGILTTDFFLFLICYSWWYIESLCKKAKKSGANKASNK